MYSFWIRYQLNVQISWFIVVGTTVFQIIKYLDTYETFPRLTVLDALALVGICKLNLNIHCISKLTIVSLYYEFYQMCAVAKIKYCMSGMCNFITFWINMNLWLDKYLHVFFINVCKSSRSCVDYFYHILLFLLFIFVGCVSVFVNLGRYGPFSKIVGFPYSLYLLDISIRCTYY